LAQAEHAVEVFEQGTEQHFGEEQRNDQQESLERVREMLVLFVHRVSGC